MAPSSPGTGQLATWDAVETRERIRRKEVTTQEVLEAAIARSERARHLGAVFEYTYERARARSASVDGEAPLAGVPTFVKDLHQLQGVATTWGSRASGPYISRKTDPFAKRFEETGVLTLGKSATPELGLTATTERVGQDPCRNPWDPSRSSGGSSGGAACMVAAGVVPIAHGSDGGGSIRIPAACCGLVGLKVSRLRLDMTGSNTLPVNIGTDGVLTRSVRDTVAFLSALESRRAPKGVPPIGPVSQRPAEPLRIGVFVDSPAEAPVATEVRDAVQEASRLCRSLGHAVEEIRCPFPVTVVDDFTRFYGFLA